MKKLLTVCLVLAALVLLASAGFGANVWAVDANGNITLNGTQFRVKGGSWFGLEGRYEISSDANNPRGAPMELYMGNVFWASSSRTYASDAQEIAGMGFNVIRMPMVPQTLDDNDAQGKDPVLKNTSSVRIQGAFTALKAIVSAISAANMHVLLDIHSCSNYIGWRAGRFDAKPPWADANRNDYDFKREDCSCAASGNPSTVTRIQAYDQTKWTANLKTLAGMTGNIFGIDIFNEPWDYTWTEWRAIIDAAYTAINSVNPNILVIAQGVGNKSTFGSTNNPNWGENLYEAGTNPPTMPKTKLVYSPHCYGPSVCTQGFFADLNAQPSCAGLQEDAFGDAKCQIVINSATLEPSWDAHFGYLHDQGYAVAIGEFGGNMDWPAKAETRMQNRYSYLTNKQSDLQWQTAFVNYLVKKGIGDSFYWSINPESSDTYGIYQTPYDPVSNTGGWGTWSGTDSRKLNLIKQLWAVPFATGTGTVAPTAVPTTPPQTPDPTAAPTTPGTAAPTTVPTATPVAGVGTVSFNPAPVSAATNSTFTVYLVANTGTSGVAGFGGTVTWNSSLATLTAIALGADGTGLTLTSNLSTGKFGAFGTTATAAGAALQLVKLTFTASGTTGSGTLGFTVDTLVDAATNPIGTPNGVGTTLTITSGGMMGDVNGSGAVDIVDALQIAQYYVGLSVTINTAVADVNCDGSVDIVDALRIAQYYVGLVASLTC